MRRLNCVLKIKTLVIARNCVHKVVSQLTRYSSNGWDKLAQLAGDPG